LPPMTAADWATVYRTYYREIQGLADPFNEGGIEMSAFQRMFAIEYIHRLLAAMVSVFFTIVLVKAIRSRELWPKVRTVLLWSAVVLLSQALIGGMVVKVGLKAQAVALHLGTGFLFLGLLLWTALKLTRAGEAAAEGRAKLVALGWVTTATAFAQIVVGGLVAGTGAGLIMNTWPTMAGHWIPPLNVLWASWITPRILNLVQNQVLLQFVHRWLAFVVVVHVIALWLRGLRVPMSPRGRIALRAVVTILILQMVLGIGNLVMKVPFWMAFVHLATGLTLFMTLLIITHESNYSGLPAAD
jgi:heme a synthase